MKNRQIHRFIYQLKHRYLSFNNVVIGLALVIAFSWVWGSLGMLERNYSLQHKLDRRQQELKLGSLEVNNLEFEQAYMKTHEYQELAVRDYLGKGAPGESVLIYPQPSSNDNARPKRTPLTDSAVGNIRPSNFEQWMDFLFKPTE